MTGRVTPEQLADAWEHETPRTALDAYRSAGYVIVHPDDYRVSLIANLFDGTTSGELTAPIELIVNEVVDVLREESS